MARSYLRAMSDDDLDALAHSVVDIDARAVEKWKLPAMKFEKRPLLPAE